MILLQKILNKFKGLHYTQEYLCLARESFQEPLHVYLVSNGQALQDITHSHAFIGYNPLIIAIPASEIIIEQNGNIEIVFTHLAHPLTHFLKSKDILASISLKKIYEQATRNMSMIYYEGIIGKHHFQSSFHQRMNRLYNTLYNNKPGNVYLEGNLYTQVQIAYSVPRVISLITVSDGKLFNLFPTDLHGPVSNEYYISSLRHDGKACRQVEESGKIVLAQIHADAYKMAYSLGKNHIQELKPKMEFPFGETVSTIFKLPLPLHLLNYHELELKASFVHGIHKIFFYNILSSVEANKEPATLAHIHNCFAIWRYRHNFKGNYLMR